MRGGVTTRAQARAELEEAARRALPSSRSSSSSSPEPERPRARAILAEAARTPLPNRRSPSPPPNRAATELENAARRSLPNSSSPPPSARKSRATVLQMTPQQCMEFVANPRVHPVTKAKILPGKSTYVKCVQECIRVLGDDHVPAIITNNILKDNAKVQNKTNNVHACLRMINSGTTSIRDPFMDSRRYALSSHDAQVLLETCKHEFGIISLGIHLREGATHTIDIPVFIKVADDGIRIADFNVLRMSISDVIQRWTLDSPVEEVYDGMITAVQKIVDSNYIHGDSKAALEDIVLELTAMKRGVVIGNHSVESPLSSAMDSANRSKSKSPRSGVSPLPKKTRAQILEDLEKTCIDMQDMIAFEDFADMKKKKLQLVVGIGPKNRDGQQRCYYVKNIYNFVKAATKEGIVPKEPMSKVAITQQEVESIIMPKMRHIKPDARNPMHVEKQKYPLLVLHITTVRRTSDGRHFFKISLERLIGKAAYWKRDIGYIAADIETDSADINSYAVIAKIRDLFDKGRLVDRRMQIRAHLNKSLEYWDNDAIRKLAHMVDELNSL